MASTSYYEGGRLIPNAGVYLAEQNKAKSAYDQAVAQLKAQRAKRQITSGLGSDWNVDPNAQYGTYQQMLQGQGLQLMQAEGQAQERGFFGAGLGNQAESALRYGHAVENLGFKNQLTDWENEYQMGITRAEQERAAANMAALQAGYEGGYSEGDYTDYSGPPVYTSVASTARALLGGPKAAAQSVIAPLRASGVLNPQATTYKVYKPQPLTPQQKKKAAGSGYGAGRAM